MALESLGLGGILTFTADKALQTMGKVGAAFTGMQKRSKRFAGGASQIGRAAGVASVALLPLAAGIGFAGAQAVKFEQQMANVSAITGATGKDFETLENLAKGLGATTSFSATQAAQGIELMGRAGATTEEIVAGLGGVLDAAAADSIDLATSAGIVSNTVRGMGLTFADSTRVANVLARASASTNTDMVGLGESFKFAAAQAKTMGVDLPTTAAALGVISDSGIKGTLAGTSFTNMLVKLAKPTAKAEKLLTDMNISIRDQRGNLLPMSLLLQKIGTGLSKFTGNVDKAAVASEVFGIRGSKAAIAMVDAFQTGRFTKILDLTNKAFKRGSTDAKDMANIRLDTVIGQFKLFKSAAEGLFIEVFAPLLPSIKSGITGITGALSRLVKNLQAGKKTGFAGGILEGIELLKAGFKTAKKFVQDLAREVSQRLGGDGAKTLGKLVILIGAAVAILAPLVAGFIGLAAIVVGVVGPAFSGIVAVISAIGLKAAIVFGILAFGWTEIKTAALDAFATISAAWGTTTDGIGIDWATVGQFILFILTELGTSFIKVITTIIEGWGKLIAVGIIVGKFLSSVIQAPITIILNLVKNLKLAFAEMASGNVLKGIQRLGATLIDFVLAPLRLIIRQVINLAESLAFTVPAKLKVFADEGFAGFINRPKISPEQDAQAKKARNAARRANEAAIRSKTAEKPADVTAELQNIANSVDKDKTTPVNLSTRVCVDGRELSVATARSKIELQERSGFKATPWQRRLALEHGAAPVGAAAG